MITVNPYNYNLPVDAKMFYGREREVEHLLDLLLLGPGDSIALIAGRRMGKTSTLRALQRSLDSRTVESPHALLAVPVLLDLSGEDIDSVASFVSTVCEYVQEILYLRHSLTLPDLQIGEAERRPARTFRRFLQEVASIVSTERGRSLRLVLLMDECEAIVGTPWSVDLHKMLRASLVEETAQHVLKVVMAGSHGFLTQVNQRGSPLWNILDFQKLRVLEESATYNLIMEPTSGHVTTEVVQAVIGHTGGHAFLTQYVMYHLWESNIAHSSIEEVNLIAERFPHHRNDFLFWARDIGEAGLNIYDVLVMAEAALTENAIRDRCENTLPNLVQALDALCYHGLVVYDSSQRTYQLTGRMFHDWFVTNVSSLLHIKKHSSLRSLQPPDSAHITVYGDFIAGDKPTGVDQRGQIIQGPQTNIADGTTGPVFSGEFHDNVDLSHNQEKPRGDDDQ